MTPSCCFYCGADKEYEVYLTEVYHRFGFKHCASHRADARRDRNAYRHRHNLVDVLDAKELPALQALFAPASFTVKRSNGALDAGWLLRYGSTCDKVYITKIGEEWAAPLGKTELVKNVRLRDLLPDATAVIAVLDAGVYAADAAAAAACVPGLSARDPSYIKQVECEGVVCRVFNGTA